MFGEKNTRALLKAQDPAGDVAIPTPRMSVATLIARAETAQDTVTVARPSRPNRRLVLTAAAAALVAVAGVGTALSVDRPADPPADSPDAGKVLVPVAYQITTQPPAAGGHLRALAARITEAPYDNRAGRYSYTRTRSWGEPVLTSADGRYVMSWEEKRQTWTAADGSGRQRTEIVAAMYPDEPSATYYAKSAPKSAEPSELVFPAPPGGLPPLPTDRDALALLMHATFGPAAVAKDVSTIYGRYPVSRTSRAMILNILADVPGFLWRGDVTDRAGRTGVAITGTDQEHHLESLLIFDPETGALLAHELIVLDQHPKISSYQVYLDYDRTDNIN